MTGVHVRVRAGGEEYALPVEAVREIAKLDAITSVPGSSPVVLGLWNLRGDVLATLDLAGILGLEHGEAETIIVGESGELRAGLAVEAVLDVAQITAEPEPADSRYLTGFALLDGTQVGLLNLESVLAAAGGGDRR